MTEPDYSVHDARLSKRIVLGAGNGRPRPGLWGWECVVCHASSDGFDTYRGALDAAELHNGGPYNYLKGF